MGCLIIDYPITCPNERWLGVYLAYVLSAPCHPACVLRNTLFRVDSHGHRRRLGRRTGMWVHLLLSVCIIVCNGIGVRLMAIWCGLHIAMLLDGSCLFCSVPKLRPCAVAYSEEPSLILTLCNQRHYCFWLVSGLQWSNLLQTGKEKNSKGQKFPP